MIAFDLGPKFPLGEIHVTPGAAAKLLPEDIDQAVTGNIGDRPVKRSVRAGMQNIRTGWSGFKSPISDGCGVCGKSRGEDCKEDSDEWFAH